MSASPDDSASPSRQEGRHEAWLATNYELPATNSSSPRRPYHLLRRVAHRVGGREVQAALGEHALAFFHVGAFHADDDRHGHGEALDRRDDARGQDVAAQDAAKDVD